MPEFNKQEIRSPELQEVLSGIPSRFLRWGLFIFFSIILILVIGSYLIKNPEIVSVPVIITTQNPPVELVARSDGEIEKLFVEEGSIIKENEIVALIANTCNYDDLKNLKTFITRLGDNFKWTEIVKLYPPPPVLTLGEVQSNYLKFQKEWMQLKDYFEQGYISTKLILLEKQIEKKIEYDQELAKQEKFLAEDLALAKSSYIRDSTLFRKDINSLSPKEFDKSHQAYIQKLYSFSVFKASMKNNEIDFIKMKETRLDLQVRYQEELKQYILSVTESFQLLKSTISQWEEKYLIISPVSGKITLNRFRNENQVIKMGETIATVIPNGPANIVVHAIIPASGFGKIELEQKVNIKLSGFPYMRYGVLKGKIVTVSQVPGEGGFTAEIVLTGGLTTSYQEKIKFIHQMDGTADIITKDTRLIEKFLSPIKSALKN